MKDQVFICYSRSDEDFVLKLAANLKQRGVPVWLDQWDIPSGGDWDQAIEKALKECTGLLLVLSPSSVESKEVRSEWRSALDENKVVVPILYQQCEIPYRLKTIQYIDLTSRSSDDEKSLEEILNALEMAGSNLIKPWTQPEQPPERHVKNASVPTKSAESQTKTEKFYSSVNKKTALIAFIVLGSLIMFTYLVPVNEFFKNLKAPENHSRFENASAWYDKGHALYERGNQSEAIQAFDKAIEINPQYADAWYNKGLSLYIQGKYDDAIKAYEKAIEIDPQYASAWYDKGLTLYAQGKYDEAVQAFNESIAIYPQSKLAWWFKGQALYDQGKYNEATIQAFDKVIEIDPQDENAWWYKGQALYYQGKYDEAIQAFHKSIEVSPTYTAVWYNIGMSLYYQGKYDEAINAFDRAINLNAPNAREAWNMKGFALDKLGRTIEAEAAFAKVKELGHTGES